MLAVGEALARILALSGPIGTETIAIDAAAWRYLAAPVHARRDQPAADNSAMDGFAICFCDIPGPWRIVGEARAGHPFDGVVTAGTAAGISTGALIPRGADCIVVREDAAREGDMLTLTGDGPDAPGRHIRRAASDFSARDTLLTAGKLLSPGALALAISAGAGPIAVGRRPSVAILSTGNELVPPGTAPAAHQITDSNGPMLRAMMHDLCSEIRTIGPVADDEASVRAAIAQAADADVLISIGGASVGEHDHVRTALIAEGGDIDFWKIAMKPGKPLMAGRLGGRPVVGLPGNPGSAFVTATLFVLPLLRHLAGAANPEPARGSAALLHALPACGARAEYLRAHVAGGRIAPVSSQSSGHIAALANARALIARPAGAAAIPAGTIVDYITLYQRGA